MKIDELIHRVVDDKRTAILLNRKAPGKTNPTQITYEVMQDAELVKSLALIRDEPFDLKTLVKMAIKGKVAAYMRSAKYNDTDVRQWEAVRLRGEREGRWRPTRGMQVWEWRASGQAKVRQGADTLRMGRLLLAMADDANARGYGDNDVVTAADFEVIVKAASRSLRLD